MDISLADLIGDLLSNMDELDNDGDGTHSVKRETEQKKIRAELKSYLEKYYGRMG